MFESLIRQLWDEVLITRMFESLIRQLGFLSDVHL